MPRASLWRHDRMNGRRTPGILRWLVSCSCEALPDAVTGDPEAGRYAALRMTGTGQHPHAAILRHGEQINDSDNSEESKGEKSRPFQDGSKGERKHDHKGNSSGETQRTRVRKSGRICSTLRRSSEA